MVKKTAIELFLTGEYIIELPPKSTNEFYEMIDILIENDITQWASGDYLKIKRPQEECIRFDTSSKKLWQACKEFYKSECKYSVLKYEDFIKESKISNNFEVW